MFNETPLPMDEASRLTRAIDAGFNDQRYHGTDRDFQSFDPGQTGARTDSGWYGQGAYFGTPDQASIYASGGDPSKALGSVIPAYLRGNRMEWDNSVPPRTTPEGSAELTRDVSALGYDGMEVRYPDDPDIYGDVAGERRETAVYNPQNIRSQFARFDPEFAHLSNLSAANADYLTGLVASGASDDEVQAAYQMILDLEGPR